MPENLVLPVETTIRLDLFLVQEWTHLQRNHIEHMIAENHIFVNDAPARKVAQILQPDDVVKIVLPVPVDADRERPEVVLPTVFEDAYLLVVDKPSGIKLRQSSRTSQASVASILAHQRPEMANIGGVGHAGLVSSLEEDASGLVLAAKDVDTYDILRRNLKRQRIDYTFTALVEGRLRGQGVIEEPIGNARHERERLQVSREGRPAITAFRAQRHYKDANQDYTLVQINPHTSRRHQIRLHLSWYGYPLVGDRLYGSRFQKPLQERLFLHLSVLEFPGLINEDILHIESPLPPVLQSIITYLARPK
jgi:23S rRNA pseudouridine1911/1915/1917 synthase